MIIASSNQKKLDEYKKMFPNIRIKLIDDLPEVLADKDTVMIQKIKSLNKFDLVIEDTILEILENNQWIEIVDIKFKIKELSKKTKARWIVSLGFMKDGKIYISRAGIDGYINPEFYLENSFGFDSIFTPEGATKTLHELDLIGFKNDYNARKEALNDLILGVYYKIVSLKSIEPWTGKWQS